MGSRYFVLILPIHPASPGSSCTESSEATQEQEGVHSEPRRHMSAFLRRTRCWDYRQQPDHWTYTGALRPHTHYQNHWARASLLTRGNLSGFVGDLSAASCSILAGTQLLSPVVSTPALGVDGCFEPSFIDSYLS